MHRSQSFTSAIRHQFRTPWIAMGMGLIYGIALTALFALFFTDCRDIVAPFIDPTAGVVTAAWFALLIRARKQLERADDLARRS